MKLSQMSFNHLRDAFELAKMEGDVEAMLAITTELLNRRGARQG